MNTILSGPIMSPAKWLRLVERYQEETQAIESEIKKLDAEVSKQGPANYARRFEALVQRYRAHVAKMEAHVTLGKQLGYDKD